MAGILTAGSRLRSISRCGRHLQQQASLQWWTRDLSLSRPLRMLMGLRPCGWLAPGTWALQPRCLGAQASSGHAHEQKPSADNFRPIYRFPGIKYCRAVSRLKLLQTALTIAILPPIWFFYWQNQVTQTQCLYSTAVAAFAAAMLYGMSFYLRRIIGFMYLNEDGTLLRVAHLTFWGKRKDIYCPVESVMTLSDVGEKEDEVLLQFKQYGQDQFLYFTLRFGQVVDREGFVKVFGPLG